MSSSLPFRPSQRIGGMLRAAAREFNLEVPGGRDVQAVIWTDDVEDVASRCWDAGFTVRLSDDSSPAASVIVIDPFGRSIEVVHAASARTASHAR